MCEPLESNSTATRKYFDYSSNGLARKITSRSEIFVPWGSTLAEIEVTRVADSPGRNVELPVLVTNPVSIT